MTVLLTVNVTRKIEKFWKFGVSRSSESVIGHVPPGHDASERLYLVGRLLTLFLRLHTGLSMQCIF